MEGMCRLCLSEKDVLIPIFYQGSDLPDNIHACLAVQVAPDDQHKRICTVCDGKLRQWWNFKLEVQSAQKFLNIQKQLYSKTVTSSGENQNLSDVSRSSTPKSENASSNCSLRMPNSYSLASTLRLGEIGPTAVIVKEEKHCDIDQNARAVQQIVPISQALDSNAYYVSSSSSGGTQGREAASLSHVERRSSFLLSALDEDDDCIVIDPPPKRMAPIVTLDDATQNKRPRMDLSPMKKIKTIGTGNKGKSGKSALGTKGQSQETSDVAGASGSLKCSYCPLVFNDKVKLSSHLKTHSANFQYGRQYIKCPYCPVSLQIYSLRGHVTKIHKVDPNATGLTNYIESKVSKGTKGIKGSTSAEPMKIVVFSCNLCKNSYKTPMALKVHKKKFHVAGATSNLLKIKPLFKKKTTVCDRCNRRLLSVKALGNHKHYCGTARASVCPFCSKQFENVQTLKRHIGEKHSGGANDDDDDRNESLSSVDSTTKNSTDSGSALKPEPGPSILQNNDAGHSKFSKTKCQQCGRKFNSQPAREEHLKYCGTVKAFKCYMCPYQFNSSRSVTNHSLSFHKKVLMPCDFCNQKFGSRLELLEHRKIHRQLMKSKQFHKCRSCQNVYNGLKSFANHKDNCRQAFPYKCDKCFLHFREESLLTSHVPQCHGKSRFQEKLELPHKSIKCLHCTKKFAGENDFINHHVESHVNPANSIFSGVNSFDCHFCFYAANNPDSLKRHLPHCKGIAFYVVKSAAPKQSQASASAKDTSKNLSGPQKCDQQLPAQKKPTPLTKPGVSRNKSSDSNSDLTTICSPAFMNEHLNASKNAQVVVEKLSDSVIQNASNLKLGELSGFSFDSIKKEPTVKPAPSPRNKVQCEYCKRYFTPAGLPTHRCHKKKRILAKRARAQSSTQVDSTSLVKCELCYEMVIQEELIEHLKQVHKAFRPAEMARIIMELPAMQPSIKKHVKAELERGLGVDANSQSDNESAELDDDSLQKESAKEDVEDGGGESSQPSSDTLGGAPLTRCEYCQSCFNLSDLEEHLRVVHHAVKPAIMAKYMMENKWGNITISHCKSEPEFSAEVDNTSPSGSPHFGESADTDQEEADNGQEEGGAESGRDGENGVNFDDGENEDGGQDEADKDSTEEAETCVQEGDSQNTASQPGSSTESSANLPSDSPSFSLLSQ